MSRQLGRISGPLLNANLLREGNDLRFENNLLYLDVNNNKVSIKDSPTNKELYINESFLTTNLLVDTLLTVQDLQIQSPNFVRSTLGPLNFVGADYVSSNNIRSDNINFDLNQISTYTSSTNLEIRPNGTGTVEVFSDLNTTGNIHATGDITADGNIIFGNENTDYVKINADVSSNILPNVVDPLIQSTYSFGTSTKRWNTLYTELYNGDAIQVGGLTTDAGINLALRPGKIWFVAANGSNTNQGNHQHGAFATIKHATSVATSGDEIYVYPGTYTEEFPITLPAGVTINGVSLRSVTIQPTSNTNDKDAFLVNGECTISNITVANFFYNSIENTGYAFRFAPNAKTTTRSPYIQNCSVITRGSVITESDPLGFDTGDAGKGALVDGSVCDATTYEAAMLFHSVTFITPGVDALTMTNGVRVEWLNSFTYYANRSLYATNGLLDLANRL